MASFATEFPVKPSLNRANFVAQVVSWLRGMNHSKVLDKPYDADLLGEAAHLRTQNGEELRLRELGNDAGLEVIGFRHDLPDDEGRLWRTEAVLRREKHHDEQGFIRLRTECVVQRLGARLDFPRKPYFIKSILLDGWGGRDRELIVSDNPIWLGDDSANLELARAVSFGKATRHLPVIYVSASDPVRWLISKDQANKLAYDLGGVAHVVMEPSRAFSFRLRDLTRGANVYGGTLAIILPDRGIVRRFYTGLRFPSAEDLLVAVREAALGIRSQMPAEGWDWTELQEQALRRQRERDRNRLSAQEAEGLYQEEILNLQDRIRQLEGQIAAVVPDGTGETDAELLHSHLTERLGPEIYPGEFTDRLRFAARECSARADQIGLDRRSKIVLDKILSRVPSSPALTELLEDLKRATKDPKRIAAELTSLLSRHGYREKSGNKHIRLEAINGYDGLDAITLPKTPSENRGLKNLQKEIEGVLGLSKLRD